MSTPFYQKARRHLSRQCPVMKRLISTIGPCTLKPNPADPFTQLVRCVIAQQISTKAAASIYGKLASLVGGPPVPMAKLAELGDAAIRSCGISGPKLRTLRAVIDHVNANPDLLPGIKERDAATIHEQLTVIKGIGPWSADMFLIFGLGHPDVLPLGDYGFRAALKTQFNLKELPNPDKATKLSAPWQPYRSIATWYLWRSLELPKEAK